MRELLKPSTLARRYSFAFALLLMVALLIADIVAQGSFNVTAQLATVAPLAILAMASTPAILSGGFDISLGPIAAFLTALYGVTLAPAGLDGAVAIPILLGIGTALGLFNGFMVAVLRVNPIVATLSGYFVMYGIVLAMLPQPITLEDNWVGALGGNVGPIPGAVFTLGIPLVVWVVLKRTAYARNLFAVGANDAAAYASGINVSAVRIAAYGLGGLFAGIMAFAIMGLITSASSTTATDYSLLAFAGVALGGTPLLGGRGGLVGPLFGAMALYLFQDILISNNVSQTYLDIVYGSLLILAVLLSAQILRLQKAPA